MDISFRPHSHMRVRLFAGRYQQFMAQLIEWDFNMLGFSSPIWTTTLEEFVPVMQSWQWGGGFLYARQGWVVDVEAYQKRVDGLTSFAPGLGDVPELEYEQGRATWSVSTFS